MSVSPARWGGALGPSEGLIPRFIPPSVFDIGHLERFLLNRGLYVVQSTTVAHLLNGLSELCVVLSAVVFKCYLVHRDTSHDKVCLYLPTSLLIVQCMSSHSIVEEFMFSYCVCVYIYSP